MSTTKPVSTLLAPMRRQLRTDPDLLDTAHRARHLAGIRPGAAPTELLEAVAKAAKAAAGDPELAAAFARLTGDTRLPGWVRLLVALQVDDRDTIAATARHTGTLAGHATGRHLGALRLPGAVHLGTLSALRLRVAGFGVRPRLRWHDIAEIAGALPSTSWWNPDRDRDRIVNAVDFRDAGDPPVTRIVAELARVDDPLLRAGLVLKLAEQTDALERPRLRWRIVEALTDVLGAESAADVAASAPRRIDVGIPADFLLTLAGSPEPRTRAVASLLVTRDHLDGPLGTVLVAALAGSDASSWVLPDLLAFDRGQLLLAAIEDVSVRGVHAAGLVRLLCRAADRGLLNEPTVAGQVSRIAEGLGRFRWLVGYLLTPALAAVHKYPVARPHVPGPVKADIAAGVWAEPRDAETVALLASGGLPRVTPEELDRARVVLAEVTRDAARNYAPDGLRCAGENHELVAEIVNEMRAQARRRDLGLAETGTDEHWARWVAALPVRDVAELLSQLSDCGLDRLPAPVQTAVGEALAAAGCDVARSMLLDHLAADLFSDRGPKTVTLLEYAHHLRTLVAHLPAR